MQSDPDVAARVAWARNLVNAADLRGPGTVLQPGVAKSPSVIRDHALE
jgi:hypothetical protein